jgi:hypothetical protein
MPTLLRILYVLRRGPIPLRIQAWQAWCGLFFIVGAAGWVLLNVLWDILIALALFALGAFLVGRSVRDSQRSSS